ncbi:FkbM family methyltransferase [Methylobacter sp. YRD-M1]|uniref:FkbM family methyltransferase n=1 Tax=Methylobacter sp. YRD-M1 TaxID=2911520 RepID=UPI00227A8CBC|nr:FkbM family methyltransferase [Methylobacter sp. YRD-M1]WAK02054.1 FkbM family methyltransferase [Methylobacter sp. YRD-M1]
MSFVSYAQNFEDVMLWRALKHVQNGVYIDVGAQHPVIDSVSKAFYEHGWRGIHIEPVPAYAELLRKDRPDETVLQVALADAEGVLELNVIPDTGLSTAVDVYAQRHQVERGYELQQIQVPVMTLKVATKSVVGKDVHWLKIDVEGLEEKVLKGWDSKTLRPWIMVIEATIPNSPETDYASWDPILTAADYQFVYFDGLNRFYVAREHAELVEAFSSPPNVFDGIELSGLASSPLCQRLIASHQASEQASAAQLNAVNEYNIQLQAQAQWLQSGWDVARQRIEELCKSAGQLETELSSTRERNEQLHAHAEWLQQTEQAKATNLAAELNAANEHNTQLQARAQWLQNELDAANSKISELNQLSHHWWVIADRLSQEQKSIYASKFWRITWPLRKIMQIAKWSLTLPVRMMKWFTRFPKRLGKPLMVWVMRKILNNSDMKNHALDTLAKYPLIKQHLRLFAIRAGLINDETASDEQINVETVYSLDMEEELINNLSPSAARIYAELLKRSIDARKN